jgi:NhaA family Na+:H+ antiporter
VIRPRVLVRPIEAFIQIEGSGGIALVAAAALAVLWVNLPGTTYHDLWGWGHDFQIGILERHFSTHAFVNDGLMAIFFYMVGLEIKRELVEGELNTLRKAALPAIAALGGMVVPALIFTAFNAGGPGAHGWGIPMATDIAFAIGVLSLLRTRVPFTLKVFLLALAIADDLGAIIVIAIFYSSSINLGALLLGVVCLLAVYAAQRSRLRQWPLYLVLGVCAWLAILESGVHATIAGVALGFLTAASRDGVEESALDRVERRIHPWVSYAIVPIFALANAGVGLSGSDIHTAATSEVSLGIGLGLLVGKPVGIVGATLLAMRLRIAELPAGFDWRHLVGAGMLGGIGFTVSLFITALAFEPEQLVVDAKIGIFAASILSGLLGLAFLLVTSRTPVREDTGVASIERREAEQSGDQPVS